MPKWTEERNEILRKFGVYSAEYCRRVLFDETGVLFSIDAIMKQCSRLKIKTRRKNKYCFLCGKILKGREVPKKYDSNICAECLEANKYISSLNNKKMTETEIKEAEEEAERAKRRYNRVRKEAEREAKKNNWEPYKDWKERNPLW